MDLREAVRFLWEHQGSLRFVRSEETVHGTSWSGMEVHVRLRDTGEGRPPLSMMIAVRDDELLNGKHDVIALAVVMACEGAAKRVVEGPPSEMIDLEESDRPAC